MRDFGFGTQKFARHTDSARRPTRTTPPFSGAGPSCRPIHHSLSWSGGSDSGPRNCWIHGEHAAVVVRLYNLG